MSKELITRSLNTEAEVVDAKKGIIKYIASDESLDGDQEIALASGWRFNRFRKNSPFVNSHRTYSINDLLGKVLSAEVIDGQLVEEVQWAIDVPENDLAKLGFAMTEAGYLKAVSVGFYATKQAYRDSNDWVGAVEAAGLDSVTASQVRRIFIEQEQYELSAVVIGSNPNAMVKAFEEGAVSEEMLASVGFGSDDAYEFLSKAAIAVESPECNEAFKAMLSIEMQRLYIGRNQSASSHAAHTRAEKTFPKKTSTHSTDSTAKTLAAALDVQARAEARSRFLGQLDSLTK